MISSSMKGNSKEVGNVNVSGRLKQIFVLILAILIGMIISATTADAKDYKREGQRKTYRKQANLMTNACQLLSAKRTNTTNFVVKDRSKLKYR